MGLSWGPFGKVFGLQAMLKPVSSVASGRPRAVSNYFWGGPKASKSAPRGIQERPIRPWKPSSGLSSLFKSSKKPPRRLQETSRAHLAPVWVRFGNSFAGTSMPCCHHVGHVSSLKAPSPRALDPRSKAWGIGLNAVGQLYGGQLGSTSRRSLCEGAFSEDT